MTPLAVRVETLGKSYRLGTAPAHHRFSELLAGVAALPARLVARRPAPAPADDFWALRDVSFDVARGEAVGVVGRNGSGKSTLLKILSRVTEPTAGRFGLRGRLGSLLEAGTGFHPELTGRENIFLSGAVLGLSRAEVRRRFDEVVAFAETGDFLDTPVKRYSSGMSIRLAFSIAAHAEPDVLVLDEVLAVGDAAFQRKCLAKVSEVRARAGCTTLVVNHDLAALRGLCSRAVWLDHGRLRADGPAGEVIARYEAEAGGGVVPAGDAGAELEPVPATLPLAGPFTAEMASHFVVRSGAWRAGPGRYAAAPTGDGTLAVSTLLLDDTPADLDISVTAAAAPGADGFWAVVLFDVESATRYRFAGRRPDGAWVVGRGRTVEAVAEGSPGLTADIRVRLRGNTVTVSDGDGVKLTHATDRAAGGVGLGTDGAARFAALSVRPAGG
jgi:ABC-type polysaccharide/polyol phosphate transport system ATPase subunit